MGILLGLLFLLNWATSACTLYGVAQGGWPTLADEHRTQDTVMALLLGLGCGIMPFPGVLIVWLVSREHRAKVYWKIPGTK